MRNSRSAALWAFATLGVVLVVAGLITYLAQRTTTTFGWFAYQPMRPSESDLIVLHPAHIWGLAMGLLGALLLSAVVGFLIGRRRV